MMIHQTLLLPSGASGQTWELRYEYNKLYYNADCLKIFHERSKERESLDLSRVASLSWCGQDLSPSLFWGMDRPTFQQTRMLVPLPHTVSLLSLPLCYCVRDTMSSLLDWGPTERGALSSSALSFLMRCWEVPHKYLLSLNHCSRLRCWINSFAPNCSLRNGLGTDFGTFLSKNLCCGSSIFHISDGSLLYS